MTMKSTEKWQSDMCVRYSSPRYLVYWDQGRAARRARKKSPTEPTMSDALMFMQLCTREYPPKAGCSVFVEGR